MADDEDTGIFIHIWLLTAKKKKKLTLMEVSSIAARQKQKLSTLGSF